MSSATTSSTGRSPSSWPDSGTLGSFERGFCAVRYAKVIEPAWLSVNMDAGWAVSTVGTFSPCPKADSIRRGSNVVPRW